MRCAKRVVYEALTMYKGVNVVHCDAFYWYDVLRTSACVTWGRWDYYWLKPFFVILLGYWGEIWRHIRWWWLFQVMACRLLCDAITWTNAQLESYEHTLMKFLSKSKHVIQLVASESGVCKMGALCPGPNVLLLKDNFLGLHPASVRGRYICETTVQCKVVSHWLGVHTE